MCESLKFFPRLLSTICAFGILLFALAWLGQWFFLGLTYQDTGFTPAAIALQASAAFLFSLLLLAGCVELVKDCRKNQRLRGGARYDPLNYELDV